MSIPKNSEISEAKQMQHLQFIQDVITRHNTNSFQIKELTVTLIAAVCGIYVIKENQDPVIFLIPTFATFFLWLLDSQYLKQEQQFRMLYKDVVAQDSKKALYDMNPTHYEDKVSLIAVMFSKTIRKFYISLMALTLVIYLYLKYF